MTTDLFIKTYPGDYQWLPYLFQSIKKYATGFRNIVIVTEEDMAKNHGVPEIATVLRRSMFMPSDVNLHIGDPPTVEGYEYQKAVKLSWTNYTDADQVLQIDSDCIFTEPVTPETWHDNGQPLWFVRYWEDVSEDHRKAWEPGAAWFAPGFPMTIDGMTRPGFLMTRRVTQALQMEIGSRGFEDPLEMFVRDDIPNMSEYGIFGVFLQHYAKKFADDPNNSRQRFMGYKLIEEGTDAAPHCPIRQAWSWGGITEEDKKAFKEHGLL